MRAIQKSLLIASLIATGASATSLVNLVDTNIKAEVNSQLNNATVTITVAKAQLYDKNGMPIAKGLTYGTSWKVGIQNNIPSGTYYSVATNEYVKASDVYLYSTVQANPFQTITITTNYAAPIYNHNGQLIPSRRLDAYTTWRTDGYHVINGKGYYRVANDEYVQAYYVR